MNLYHHPEYGVDRHVSRGFELVRLGLAVTKPKYLPIQQAAIRFKLAKAFVRLENAAKARKLPAENDLYNLANDVSRLDRSLSDTKLVMTSLGRQIAKVMLKNAAK